MTEPHYHSDTWGNRTHYSKKALEEKKLTPENFHLTTAMSGIYANPSPYPYFERGEEGVLKRLWMSLLQRHRFRIQFAWNSKEAIFQEIVDFFPDCEKKPRCWNPLHIEYKGKKFNGTLMKHAEILKNMEEHIPRENFKRVCEIGAGYGVKAEMIIKRYDPEYFYIIDLPETLEVSRLYLSSVFPDKIDKTILFVSAEEYEKLDVPISLFVNTNSFAEMPYPLCEAYFKFIERNPGAYLSATNPPRFEGEYLYAGPETYPYNDNWEIIWKGRQKLYYYRKNYQIISKVRGA